MAASIRGAVRQVDPNLPVTSIRAMSEIVAASTPRRRFKALLLGGFTRLAIVLASLGNDATLSYSVNRHCREIGIRPALGAQPMELDPVEAIRCE